MKISKGQIVASKAGHDENRFFIVTDISGGCLFLADGKERKLSSPKKKNPKHIAVTNTIVEIPATDKELRKLINSFSRLNQED
ncbi:MAG: KOW domain-containing RNA-binding protein [Ruminococcus sp.]|jgi:ribosomal protein L14E/L6E/L27E|nr:KOW domain-containing RNA-binding protein [Ruminococcus sp.]